MNCSEAEILIHALIDGELDAGHTRDVETHLAGCPQCTAKLAAFRQMRAEMSEADLKESAPLSLRNRIEAALPAPASARSAAPIAAAAAPRFNPWRMNRRLFAAGFGFGTVLSGAVAASLVLGVFHDQRDQRIAGEVVTAHLRSLQPGHLTDVETSDQHSVKPWFNGKLDVAPPVVDLTAQGFTLVGGRLDDIDGETAAAIVYRRHNHVINLFVARQLGAEHKDVAGETRHGFGVRYWTAAGLDFWAVSDISADELDEFCQKLRAALRPPPPAS